MTSLESKNRTDTDVVVAGVEPTGDSHNFRPVTSTKMRKDNKHPTSPSPNHHSFNHRETKRGLRSKSNRAEPNSPTPTAPTTTHARSRPEKRGQIGLNGTKFRPSTTTTSSDTNRDSESRPGAHGACCPESLQERGIASPPPTVAARHDGVVEVAVAQLVTEESKEFDEEAIRHEAELEAEKRLMNNAPRAEVVTESQDEPVAKKRRWIVLLLLLLFVAITAVAAVAIAVVAKDSTATELTISPTVVTSAPFEWPSIAPSEAPSEPFTNDFCQGARELEGDSLWMSSTIDATLDEGFATCGSIRNNGRGQWLQVRGDNAWLRVHTCNEYTNYDTQLSVYKDEGIGPDEGSSSSPSSCLSATCVTGNDQFCGDQSYVQWFGEENTLYWVLVHGYRHYTGDFVLEIVEEKNEHCSGALNVSQPIFQQERGRTDIETSMARAAPIQQEQLPYCRDGPKPDGVGIWFAYDGNNNNPKLSVGNGLSLAVYSGSCERLSCTAPLNELGELKDEVGVTYFILVYGQDSESISEEPFHLSVEWAQFGMMMLPQPNSFCEEVQGNPEFLLTPGQGSLQGRTSSFSWLTSQPVGDLGSCGDSVFFTSDGVWYTVVGTGLPMTVSTCSNQSDVLSTNPGGFDTQISVFEGSCNNLICIDGNDQHCGDQSAVSWFTEMGVSYSVLVHGYGQRHGSFEVSYEELETFGDKPRCDDATPIISDGSSVLGTATFEASSDPDGVGYCGYGGNTNTGVASWFKGVGTGQTWTASTCSSSTGFPTRVSVYEGSSCSELACVEGTVSSPCGEQNAVTWKTTRDKVYYILVHGTGPSYQGNFVLTLEETPTHDDCEGAIGPLIPDGATMFASTRSATFDDTLPSCSTSTDGTRASAGRGVFYSVLGSGRNMTATTCLPYTNFDMQVSVYNGGCGDELQCLNVQINDCPMNANNVSGVSITWPTLQDEVYYLSFQGNDEETGNFAFQLHSEDEPLALDSGL